MTKGELIIRDIVDEIVEEKMLFSLYDIIPEAKARGCRLDKYRIGNIIHNVKYPIWYTKTQIDIKGVMIEVYHSDEVDAGTYDYSDVLKEIKKSKKYKAIDKKLDKVLYEKLKIFDALNMRYTVPSFKVKSAGFRAGDKVLLKARKNVIELKQGGKVSNKVIVDRHLYDSIMTVDGHLNIKVHKSHFQKAFDKTPNSITVKSNRGIIKILSDSLY